MKLLVTGGLGFIGSNFILKILNENQKNPERIATSKGQNLQNLENTKKRNEEIENELIDAEKKYNSINQNLKEIQSKISDLKENIHKGMSPADFLLEKYGPKI